MQPLTKYCLCAVLALTGQAAWSLEFRSAASHGVVLHDSPGGVGRKLFVISQGTPLEVQSEQGDWLRVRDQAGTLAWVRKQDASTSRTLQVIRAATVFREASTKSAAVFRASPGLLLNLQESTRNGWARIRHRDGASGFIRIEDVWGL